MFGAYVRERFRLAVFGPTIAVLVAAALWASGETPRLPAIVCCAGLTTLLLLQFRLWDDLEDRERDRVSHPGRVLVGASAVPFRFALVALGGTNIALMAASGPPLAPIALASLDLTFWLAYRRLRPRVGVFIWRFPVLLVKYPAFVVVLAAVTGTAQPARLAASVFAIYASACAYEMLHDKRETSGVVL
jgi:4-hydroxybenzoate polyprenyltransferase